MIEKKNKTGFILIDKEENWTSYDVVNKLKIITGIKKIGHAGTLDPFATGLLILAIGRVATKQINNFVHKDKEYIADIFLGAETDTYDKTGKITQKFQVLNIKENKIKQILKSFEGKQEQIPPMYSAKKVKGKKLYELARKGIEIKRKANLINIYKINLLEYNYPNLKIKIKCSKGTYIRSLAFDIGRKLKTGAYLKELKRIKIGNYNLNQAHKIESISKNNWTDFIVDSILKDVNDNDLV